ncbi:hypothetical protein Ancab_030459 [Ancistrocladus abbreviatus]
MTHILAPTLHLQMRITRTPTIASPVSANTWSSTLLKQNQRGLVKNSAKFRVFAVKSESSTVNRLEQLLNLDVTPHTDKIIAEYIWIGGSGIDLRSKSRTISQPVEHPSELP